MMEYPEESYENKNPDFCNNIVNTSSGFPANTYHSTERDFNPKMKLCNHTLQIDMNLT